MNSAVIIGGGVAGLVSSIALRRAGVRTQIVEAGKYIRGSKYTYSGLWDPSIKVLSQLGVYDDIKADMQSVKSSGFKSVDGKWLMQPTMLRDHPEHPSLSFVRDDILIRALYKHVDDPISVGTPVSRVYRDQAEAVVETTGGEIFRADFVVGADGWNSIVRRCSLGVDRVPTTSRGYQVIRGHSTDLPSSFLADFEAFQTWGPGRRFAAVPTKNGVAWFAAISHSFCASNSLAIPLAYDAVPFSSGDGNINDNELQRSLVSKALLGSLFKDWHQPVGQIIDMADCENGSDGSSNCVVRVDDAMEGTLGYKGWESILRTDNGTAMPTPVAPTSPATKITLTDRLADAVDSLHSAPLALYVGDAACTIDPILAQGAGLAIESAFGLSRALAEANAITTNVNGDRADVGNKDSRSSVDRDALQSHLIDFHTSRHERCARIKELSTLAHTMGTLDSEVANSARNGMLAILPSGLKRTAFDYFIERSLY